MLITYGIPNLCSVSYTSKVLSIMESHEVSISYRGLCDSIYYNSFVVPYGRNAACRTTL